MLMVLRRAIEVHKGDAKLSFLCIFTTQHVPEDNSNPYYMFFKSRSKTFVYVQKYKRQRRDTFYSMIELH